MLRDIVVIAASRGAVPVLRVLVERLDPDPRVILLIVMHVGRHPSILPDLLTSWGRIPAFHPAHGESMQRGNIYVAPPDRHMVVRGNTLCLLDTAAENFSRPAADPLFRSAAREYRERVVGVVLTGDLDDGAAGLAAVGARGGYLVVQDPDDCEAPSMPRCAMAAVGVDAVSTREALPDMLRAAIEGVPRREETIMAKRMPGNRPDLDREAAISEGGLAEPAALDEIGERAALTCPSCHGALWRLRDDQPLRYRCHTGHAFSSLSLEDANAQNADDAIWGAIRAVHERIILARERLAWARRASQHADAEREQLTIVENEKLVELLRPAVRIPSE